MSTSGGGAASGPEISTGRVPVHLEPGSETLFIPLYARALDFRSRRSILHDRWADEIVRSVDFDFEKQRIHRPSRLLVARSRELDETVRAFLAAHPDGSVLNFGCGLDARLRRVGPGPSVRWFDIDLPEVIRLRQHFYAERDGYRMIAASLGDPDWWDGIPRDRPAVAVADGVFEYLTKEQVGSVVRRLVDRVPHGTLSFDVMNSTAMRSGNTHLARTSGAELRWAVDDLWEVDSLDARLRRVAARPLFRSRYLPWGSRLVFLVAYLAPSVRDLIRILTYEF